MTLMAEEALPGAVAHNESDGSGAHVDMDAADLPGVASADTDRGSSVVPPDILSPAAPDGPSDTAGDASSAALDTGVVAEGSDAPPKNVVPSAGDGDAGSGDNGELAAAATMPPPGDVPTVLVNSQADPTKVQSDTAAEAEDAATSLPIDPDSPATETANESVHEDAAGASEPEAMVRPGNTHVDEAKGTRTGSVAAPSDGNGVNETDNGSGQTSGPGNRGAAIPQLEEQAQVAVAAEPSAVEGDEPHGSAEAVAATGDHDAALPQPEEHAQVAAGLEPSAVEGVMGGDQPQGNVEAVAAPTSTAHADPATAEAVPVPADVSNSDGSPVEGAPAVPDVQPRVAASDSAPSGDDVGAELTAVQPTMAQGVPQQDEDGYAAPAASGEGAAALTAEGHPLPSSGTPRDATQAAADGDGSEPLPPNWDVVEDAETGYVYYWNTVTDETSWERPTETGTQPDSEFMEAAATKIQAVWRGALCRRHMRTASRTKIPGPPDAVSSTTDVVADSSDLRTGSAGSPPVSDGHSISSDGQVRSFSGDMRSTHSSADGGTVDHQSVTVSIPTRPSSAVQAGASPGDVENRSEHRPERTVVVADRATQTSPVTDAGKVQARVAVPLRSPARPSRLPVYRPSPLRGGKRAAGNASSQSPRVPRVVTVDDVVAKYRKGLHMVFLFYSTAQYALSVNKGSADGQSGSASKRQGAPTINVATFVKFCRDFGLLGDLVSGQEIVSAFKETCTAETREIAEDGFCTSLAKCAHVALSRPPYVHKYPERTSQVKALFRR